ncbi:Long-chain-alcohol oxidase [Trema orientale]|uniref:(R)-mandelonitrile lyase n=1 Tax=Trema orientale TaxID=63057 RepID=A0A2P5CC27_TREOI|nr:Long-chain-alcohol oxidase [Trema orientale]
MAAALFPLVIITVLCIFHHQCLEALTLATKYENDFSYMKAVQNATDLPPAAEYDYIVVGGGTAGCPLAATLSANYSVLVLERGGDPTAYQDVFRAEEFEANMLKLDNGTGPIERFKSEDGVENVRGRVLGGSSMINMGFYSRAERDFYRKSGVRWDFGLVENAYEWVEEAIVHGSDLLDWQTAMKEALLEAGVGPYNGFSLDHKLGTKVSGSIFDEFGGRHGAVELLNRGDLSKLRVAVHATVERILFSSGGSGLTATGVIFKDSEGKSHKAFVRNKGEVILSAGTIGSPQLLLLSGVGPVSDLSFLKIPVVQPQPHVGKFVADNPRNNINMVVPFTLYPSFLQIVGITPDFYLETASYIAPFTTAFASKSSSLSGNLSTYPPLDLSVATICTKVPGPSSYGSLSLASSVDVKVIPTIRFNYLSDPRDLARCVKALRKVGDLFKTKALAGFKFDKDFEGELGFKFFGPSLPMDYESSNSSVEDVCRSTVTTWWHYHGGCLVGKVVDGEFRVMGIKGLRVVDGSVFSVSPGTNPQATIMMLGRYVGLRMLRQRIVAGK